MASSVQRIESTRYPGSLLRLTRAFPLDSAITGPRERDLLKNLTLTRGIGRYRQSRLRGRGYEDLVKLATHPTWSKRAEVVLEAIDKRDVAKLTLLGASYPELLSFFSFGDIAVVDIETLGLTFNYPIILVGVLSLSSDGCETRQYMAIDYHLEAPMLHGALADLSGFPVLVTFNGKAFDVPYVNHRASFLGIGHGLDQLNIDLLLHARRCYRKSLPDCKLTTLERICLGIERKGDIPGGSVPAAYQTYLDTGDLEYAEAIFEHNLYDLKSLFKLFLLALDEM